MKWRKLGRVFEPRAQYDWLQTHAAVPFAEPIEDGLVRIYFSARDRGGRARTGWLVLDPERPDRILELSPEPLLPLGELGHFDEDGVMGAQVLPVGAHRFLYYIGWNRGLSVPFRNAIGLAIAEGDSQTFTRYAKGPILDRNPFDPCFVASGHVLRDRDGFHMWYLSCDRWERRARGLVHFYNIKYATSPDGIFWCATGRVCIDYRHPGEYAISVPRVVVDPDRCRMWYAYRGSARSETYRIGYAESDDMLSWRRLDDRSGIDVSPGEWDGEMICYPFVFDHAGARYLLYNGDGYGRTGLGIAILEP